MISGGPDGQELATMLAERAIRRRLLEYCRGIDRLDAALVASVYHPDGTDDHGVFNGLGVDFAHYAIERLADHAEATMHFLGDSIIDFDDECTARVETYVHAEHRCRDDDSPYLERFGGRYVDRFEARDGDWRIAHRLCLREWDERVAVTLAFAPGRFAEGRRDRGDPAYGDAG